MLSVGGGLPDENGTPKVAVEFKRAEVNDAILHTRVAEEIRLVGLSRKCHAPVQTGRLRLDDVGLRGDIRDERRMEGNVNAREYRIQTLPLMQPVWFSTVPTRQKELTAEGMYSTLLTMQFVI